MAYSPEDDTSRFLAAVLESSPDAIIAVDLDGRIVSWNAAAEHMIGYPARQALGQELINVIPEDNREAAAKMIERARLGEVLRHREVTRLRRDGSVVIGVLNLAPIRDADGRICGTLGILRDITEHRAVEEALRRTERLAAIGTLAAGIAHEINNPVGGILMAAQYTSSVLERPDADAIVEKALHDIEADAKRCRDIVKGLLQFAREERGARTACDISEIITSAIALANRSVVDKGAAVHFVPDPEIPRLSLNRTEMEQALVNLINNAVESGSREVTVAVVARTDMSKVRITIEDDGAGIRDSILERLFDPFFTTRRDEGGTGLGLSLAHAIITDHGGVVDVASSSSRGTTLTIDLPVPEPSPDRLP